MITGLYSEDSSVHVEIENTVLPGIGVRQEIQLAQGNRLSVVTRRNGLRDLVLYDTEDPDSAAATVELTNEEANTVAELLGAPS